MDRETEDVIRSTADGQPDWMEIITMVAQVVRQTMQDVLAEDAAKKGDRRRHNTRLLLEHYQLLKEHCAIVSDDQAIEDPGEITQREYYDMMTQLVSKWDVRVQSVEVSASRTFLLMQHVERGLASYRMHCEVSLQDRLQRRWRVLEARYLSDAPSTTAQIANDEFVDVRTIRRDIDDAVDDLAVVLFGIDGLSVS